HELVAKRPDENEGDGGENGPGGQQTDLAAGDPAGRLTGDGHQVDQIGDEEPVERGVPPGAFVTMGEGHLVGPGGDAQGPGPTQIQETADHRLELEGERARGRSEADDLEEHGPDEE